MRFIVILFCNFLIGGIVCSSARGESNLNLKIRGESAGNWWILGETVIFRPQTPGNFKSVTGVVCDSHGKEITHITVAGEDFFRQGWHWKPEQPGFYEIEFTATDNSERTYALGESFKTESFSISPKDGSSQPLPPLVNERYKHGIAVIPRPNRTPDEIPPLFGVSLNTRADQPYDIAAKVGFHFIRIHPIAWYIHEPEEGKYDWSTLDHSIEGAQNYGFHDFVGNVFGTPKWASTAPEDVKKTLQWKNRYTAYMPHEVDSWTKFLEATAKRYPQIRTWELWNEPHFPGQSIFWMDSPENFVRLLTAGYNKLKALDPSYTICMGGIGMRYLGFYDRVIELGAGKSFDVLALHGFGASPQPFAAIDRRYNIAVKPWITTEWHGILVKSGDTEFPTESQLATRMLNDLLPQIREGAEKIALFTLANVPGGEAEVLKQLGALHANRQTVSGLFRCRPYFEPRFVAVVYRNFVDCFSGKIHAMGSYVFFKTQVADLFTSDAGEVLVIRNTGSVAEPITQALVEAQGKKSQFVDWEGNVPSQNKDGRSMLEPGVFYYLKAPSLNVVQKWKQMDREAADLNEKVELNEQFWGTYGAQPHWLEITNSDHRLSARISVDFNAEGMDLTVDLTGPMHVQNSSTLEMSQGDSIEFALDTAGNGRAADSIEFRAALTKKGPVLWKATAPPLGGDWPSRYSYPGTRVEFGTIKVDQKPTGLRYHIHIDKDDLYPFVFVKGQKVRFALLVNSNDGQGNISQLEWGRGIWKAKNPALFGSVIPAESLVLVQSDLCIPKQNVAVESSSEPSVLRIRSEAGKNQAAMVSTNQATVKPGEIYEIRFQTRGNVNLKMFASITDGTSPAKRVNFGSAIHPTAAEWKSIAEQFVIPAGATAARINLLCWEQAGTFEVRNFQVHRVKNSDIPTQ